MGVVAEVKRNGETVVREKLREVDVWDDVFNRYHEILLTDDEILIGTAGQGLESL
jgi:hypothetical protein